MYSVVDDESEFGTGCERTVVQDSGDGGIFVLFSFIFLFSQLQCWVGGDSEERSGELLYSTYVQSRYDMLYYVITTHLQAQGFETLNVERDIGGFAVIEGHAEVF